MPADAEPISESAHVKRCRVCGDVKALTAFPVVKANRDHRGGACNCCKWAHRKTQITPEQSASICVRVKRWKKRNCELVARQKRRARERAAILAGRDYKSQEARSAEAEQKISDRRTRHQKWIEEAKQKPWNDPGLTSAERFAVRYKIDPQFNLKQRLRAHFRRTRQGIKCAELLRGAIVRGGKSPKAEAFLGYTVSELRKHIERQFVRGMTWERFCGGEIHIDHIVPLSSFDLSSADGLRAAWALSNLRPLWARDNIAKAARRTHLL